MDFKALESYATDEKDALMSGWVELNDSVVEEMGKRAMNPLRALTQLFDKVCPHDTIPLASCHIEITRCTYRTWSHFARTRDGVTRARPMCMIIG